MARVLAVVTFLANIGYWIHDDLMFQDTMIQIDAKMSVIQEEQCIEDHTRTPTERQACLAEADKTLHGVSRSLLGQTWREKLVR